MAKKTIILLAVILVATKASADTVEYNLSGGGSYTPSTNWTENFDLGVTFSQISHVYISWSGSIKAAKFQTIVPTPLFEPYCDGYFIANIYEYNSGTSLANRSVYGGKDTAPNSEAFNLQSEFNLSNFSPFLDGTGSVRISLGQTYPLEWYSDIPIVTLVSNASGQLNSAKLVFEGTVVPEPATLFLLGFGSLALLRKHKK